ncbi:Uncharacterised protein [Mycobacteroides abscessus subsp. abscessus]|nr:Uncharacterised protein [Mycobacteroides abscessus subsp. abscessus]
MIRRSGRTSASITSRHNAPWVRRALASASACSTRNTLSSSVRVAKKNGHGSASRSLSYQSA